VGDVAFHTDFHNHLIPGVDDGARDAQESAAALCAFRREQVRQVITTPHLSGWLTHDAAALSARLAEIDAGWSELQRVVDEDAERMGSPMRVARGAEIALDVPDPDLTDARLRLAGGAFALVEFPGLRLPTVNAAVAIAGLRARGWIPVIAHPERYRNLAETLEPLEEFLAAGGLLQLNAGSLFGDYGRTAATLARRILARGLAAYASSDYHATGEPGVARFVRALAEAGFRDQAKLLTITNPGRLLAGEMPLAVEPIEMGGTEPWWRRMLRG
jgi:protein-tyrosine phosphatase